MNLLNLSQLKQQAGECVLAAAVNLQLQQRQIRQTRTGKPYCELQWADATGGFALKIWEDRPYFAESRSWPLGSVWQLWGQWTQNAYGLDAAELEVRELADEERVHFFRGDGELQARQDRDWQSIRSLSLELRDPRLRALCDLFLQKFGELFRRTAAARRNHHARRGGLVEHVAQMQRVADALCALYPEWNRDLLLAGVLFHDCGKLWENSYPKEGFQQTHSLRGELLGHIPLGIEVVNALWRELMQSEISADWAELEPTSEEVRLHLLHLIASHHGQYEFGSPTLPRSPEAFALHYIDNLDAKMEMLREAYLNAQEITPQIREKIFPLPANIVTPLAVFQPEDIDSADARSTQTNSDVDHPVAHELKADEFKSDESENADRTEREESTS